MLIKLIFMSAVAVGALSCRLLNGILMASLASEDYSDFSAAVITLRSFFSEVRQAALAPDSLILTSALPLRLLLFPLLNFPVNSGFLNVLLYLPVDLSTSLH